MWGLELWDLKDEENEDANNKFNELVGEEDMEDDDEEEVKVTKPEKPIFAMNADEIRVFFGQLLKDLYKLEGQVKYKLWAKKDSDGNVDIKATKLKAYDAKAEEILPQDSYFSRGQVAPTLATS